MVIVGSPGHDIHVTAIVQLEKKDLPKQEEHETEVFKMRSKLYRYHMDNEDGAMWKERGVGDVRILKHENNGTYRLVMRRDKTLKLCANHKLLPNMEIKQHASSDKALVWSTPSDFADGASSPETLCIRFGKPEGATEFKEKFEECVNSLKNKGGSDEESERLNKGGSDEESERLNKGGSDEESEKFADELSSLNVNEEKENNNDNRTDVVKSEEGKKDETSDANADNEKSNSETSEKQPTDSRE